MSSENYFESSYQRAREKFLTAANDAGASIFHYAHPEQRSPDGSELAIDVAEIRSTEQRNLLLIISGTHGVEGFCGSGCQVGFLVDRIDRALDQSIGVVLIHALNPFGFAWLRRVNEDNVDLNRNFRDFTTQPPPAPAYEEIHDWLVPLEWDGPTRQRADLDIQKHLQNKGMAAFQAAVSGGQYSRSDGLFYGGKRESWSNRILREIIARLANSSVRRIAVVDLHTGLGPAGYGEPIYVGTQLSEYLRAQKWFGPEVTSTLKGDSTSASVSGSVVDVMHIWQPKISWTSIALEYGTISPMEVLTALRADNWLHIHSKPGDPLWAPIKKQMRDAFYIDKSWWKAAVYGRFLDMVLRAGRGLP